MLDFYRSIALSFFILISSAIFAQNMKVKGVIISAEDNEPVIGAIISAKGKPNINAVTDIEGHFTINVPADVKTLTVKYMGMKTVEVSVKENLSIILQPESQMLSEVTVTTGIGKVDKRIFTGATDKLDASATKLDGVADVSRALEGRSAGVSVQNVSGTFGTAPKIRIRGATSMYGSSKPLWVLDGVVVENIVDVSADELSSGDAVTLISSAIAGLNSEDIENFQILKDGSATSIYGARAMAGVIVITTKKGRVGVNSLSYTGEFTYRMKPSYNDFNIMNSQDQMGVYQEMRNKGWLNFAESYRASNSGVYGKMYQLINTATSTGFALENSPEAINAYLRQAEMRNTDWFDLLFNSNVQQSHSVSVSSGNEKSSFYASLSMLDDPGWTKKSNMTRYTGNLNVNYNIHKNLSMNLITVGSYREQIAPGTLGQSVDVVNGAVKRDFDINPYSYALNSSRALDPNAFYTSNYAPFNILHELENNFMNIDVMDLKFQGELKWKAAKGLEFSGLAALNYKTSSQKHDIKDPSNQALAYRAMGDATIRDNNPFLYKDPELQYSLPISVLPEGGIVQRTDYKMKSVDMRATVSWVEGFNDTHIINFYGGAETNTTNRNRSWFTGMGLQYSMGETPFFVYQYFKKLQGDGGNYYSISSAHSRMAAFFGSGTYSYKGIYSLNLTGRYEGTNQMGKSRNARWLPTWNVGLAWNVHEEKFFEEYLSAVLSHLTFKTSYSLTGSPVPEFISNSAVIIKSKQPYRPPFSDVKENELYIESLENSELTYEKKHEFNVGTEIGFLNNRINLTFDWYKRNNFDLIGVVSTQGVGGELSKYANVADMKSGGFEFSLTSKNIVTKDFDWTSNLIYGKNKTEVTRLETEVSVIELVTGGGFAKEGYAVRGLFSIPFKGLDENGIPTFLREDGSISSAQNPSINFQNRSKLDYLKYEGPTDPTVTGGFGNIFRYKSIRLNIFTTYAFGNVVRLAPVFNSAYSDLTAMRREFNNRWMVPGDEEYTNVPAILSKRQVNVNMNLSEAYNAYNYSDIRVAKGDFIRLKEVSLTYDFPKGLIPNVSNLSLKVQATNLFLLYADKKLNGQDPEFVGSGGVSAPVPRQYTLTIRAAF